MASCPGHEAKYVILSVVRTNLPGFLSSDARSNVMLTRCQAGMVIVTNKDFVDNHANKTLLGKLAIEWSAQYATTWIDWRLRCALNKSAELPGGARAATSTKVVNAHTAAPGSHTSP